MKSHLVYISSTSHIDAESAVIALKGRSVSTGRRSATVENKLISICKIIGEDPDSVSETDIIILTLDEAVDSHNEGEDYSEYYCTHLNIR